jgi:protoporphyrinogen oxidase
VADKPLVVVAGAGPAGLTFAHELLLRGTHRVLVVEPEAQVGGLARTAVHGGKRLDLGGHRFFSKSDRVLEWWSKMLPFDLSGEVEIGYQNSKRRLSTSAVSRAEPGAEAAFLVRPRVSRIYYDGGFFDYPLAVSARTVRALGASRLLAIALSWVRAKLTPSGAPRNLEEFFVGRFGRRLYETFFKSYTEKVWGRTCADISAEWGAQRVKSLSLLSALRPARVEKFLYPRRGPGQLWEEAARRVVAAGGEIRLNRKVAGVEYDGSRVRSVTIEGAQGTSERLACALFVSTMPVKDLLSAFDRGVPPAALAVARALEYRDFVTVGLLVGALKNGPVADTWIYVHDPAVKLGRVQLYNNWSEGMIDDPSKVWLGLEYFCAEGDELWRRDDADLIAFAAAELRTIGFLGAEAPLDGVVLRVPKAYPAYWGAYERFGEIRKFVDAIPNLFLVGRNGMHRYNNQDHSMLAAMAAVDCVAGASADKSAIWAVNADDDYHEGRA